MSNSESDSSETDNSETNKTAEREKLITLIRQVQTTSACVTDFDSMMNRLEKATGFPDIGLWLFHPPDGKPRTAEQIADKILADRRHQT